MSTTVAMMKKSLATLVVIVAGVVIGLAADRWIKAIDNRHEESKYIAALLDNLRSDSARLVANAASANEKGAWTIDLLLFVEDERLPKGVDTTQFMRRVTLLTTFTPTDFARETWDDLISSGKIEAISDVELRKELSTYYNGIDRMAALERDWEQQLYELEKASWKTQDPLGRLTRLNDSGVPQDVMTKYTRAHSLQRLRSTIMADEQLHASLGQARVIRNVAKKFYMGQSEALAAVIAAVREKVK